MRKIDFRLIFAASLLFASLLLINACKEDSPSNPTPVSNYESNDFAILDFEDAMNAVEGGTLDSEFKMEEPSTGENNFSRTPEQHDRKGRHLRQILWLLELSADQVEEVRAYILESHECGRIAFSEFHDVVQPMLHEANEERNSLIQQYRSGEITNDELYFELRELRENTRELIENDADVQSAKQMICDCKLSLLENIASMLNDDQLIIWNDWVNNLEDPCFD